ncbi:hypothetical protein SISNIDRAFT_407267 [Sistotremastrum niveocremeum HHB9708]|uniref:CxC2-like cysteine cluster KDZ transposase-associated domain-containing protein n=1 Tax=Sistotremastrum niveocremeum HHB9708 TaxID=1314777 RepID=A0A164Y2H9_9AGAM|nr:hypothetical protein SISNIDRAFT_407267 [Sistotremastrum niveocremeum HHB9708]
MDDPPFLPPLDDHLNENTGSRAATVEDADDDPDASQDPEDEFVERFPVESRAGYPLRSCPSIYESHRIRLQAEDKEMWSPFESEGHWDLAKWLATSGVSQNKINSFLKLPVQDAKFPFSSARGLYKTIDTLPKGPEWKTSDIKVTGDRLTDDGAPEVETVELYFRNILECIQDIIGDPALKDDMKCAPCRVWSDETKTERFYSEMWTGDWWWETQMRLPQRSTIVPVIFATDKTNLSLFSGDKVAWPVYMTIGNLNKSTRRKVSRRAWRLVGYLPVAKLECFTTQEGRRVGGWELYHECMRQICEPLYSLGPESGGVEMACSDNKSRRIYPFVAVFTVDHPERCLIACCKDNYCPECEVDPKKREDPTPSKPRSRSCIELLDVFIQNPLSDTAELDRLGIRSIKNPFWRNLPVFHVYKAFPPDLLHQLHKGIFHSHLVPWICHILGEQEVDARFKCIPKHSTLRHFAKGILTISQWTGREAKEMEKVMVSVLGGERTELVVCARALLDFIYYSSFTQHSTETLELMQSSLAVFHDNKDVFVELGAREHFNFPKFHALIHFIDHIKRWGSLDGYNTEISERLHIEFAKVPYRRSNRKDHLRQQTLIMNRQEALHFWSNFIRWAQDNWRDVEEDDDADDADDASSEAGSDVAEIESTNATITIVDEEGSAVVQVKPEGEDDDAIRLS